MSMIIKDRIQQLMKGYPTVSDKYDVAGAILAGSTPVEFGSLVKFSGTDGYFEAITTTSPLTGYEEAAGFVVATNVKLATEWPGKTVEVNPGEAFNLLVKGFIAIELDSEATLQYVNSNEPVYVILATGKLTTSDKASDGVVEQLPNTVFTGIVENHGTTSAPKLMAEIYVK